MKNEGFTLVELLAILVILSIISLIAVPVVLNLIDRSKEKTLEASTYSLIEAGENYFAANNLDGIIGNKITLTSEDGYSGLETKGSKPDGKVIIDQDGIVKVMVYNDKMGIVGYSTTNNLEITKFDDEMTLEKWKELVNFADEEKVEYGPGATKIISNVVTSGDGLYKDTYEKNRYVYKGKDPNNKIVFNGEAYRIISIEPDSTIKIIRVANISGFNKWDSTGSNNWARPATSNTDFNTNYYGTLSQTAKSQIESHSFNIGAVTSGNNDLAGQIAEEKSNTWTGNIGMISLSDYLRANTNIEQCGSFSLNNQNSSACFKTNYLSTNNSPLYTITPIKNTTNEVYEYSIAIGSYNIDECGSAYNPVIYLKSSVNLTGNGSATSPYCISGETCSTNLIYKFQGYGYCCNGYCSGGSND